MTQCFYRGRRVFASKKKEVVPACLFPRRWNIPGQNSARRQHNSRVFSLTVNGGQPNHRNDTTLNNIAQYSARAN
jgi:hypothetical protein